MSAHMSAAAILGLEPMLATLPKQSAVETTRPDHD